MAIVTIKGFSKECALTEPMVMQRGSIDQKKFFC